MIEIEKTKQGKTFERLGELKTAKGEKIAANAMRQIIGAERWLKPIPAPDGSTDVCLDGFYFYFRIPELVYDENIQNFFGRDLVHRILFEAGSEPKTLERQLLSRLRALKSRLESEGVLVIAKLGQGPPVSISTERREPGGIH